MLATNVVVTLATNAGWPPPCLALVMRVVSCCLLRWVCTSSERTLHDMPQGARRITPYPQDKPASCEQYSQQYEQHCLKVAHWRTGCIIYWACWGVLGGCVTFSAGRARAHVHGSHSPPNSVLRFTSRQQLAPPMLRQLPGLCFSASLC